MPLTLIQVLSFAQYTPTYFLAMGIPTLSSSCLRSQRNEARCQFTDGKKTDMKKIRQRETYQQKPALDQMWHSITCFFPLFEMQFQGYDSASLPFRIDDELGDLLPHSPPRSPSLGSAPNCRVVRCFTQGTNHEESYRRGVNSACCVTTQEAGSNCTHRSFDGTCS